MVLYQNFLTDEQIQKSLDYKYQVDGVGWIETQLKKFWTFCVEMLPMNLAPNLISQLGIFGLIIPAAFILAYDISLTSRYPAYIHVISLIGLFVNQTLDGMDGIQARRIKKGSPQGQQVDHGLDTWTYPLKFVIWASLGGFNNYFFVCYFSFFIVIANYNSDLQEYFTNIFPVKDVCDYEILFFIFYIFEIIFGYGIPETTIGKYLIYFMFGIMVPFDFGKGMFSSPGSSRTLGDFGNMGRQASISIGCAEFLPLLL